MNKLSKLTALLLALVLALGVPMQVMAEGEEIETWTEYMDIAKEALKTKIMAYETYGEYWDMVKLIEESDFEDFFYTLPLEDQNAIAKYVNDMFWASLVGYTNVAPFPELVETAAPASMLRLTARDGDTGSEEAKGLYTDKQVSGPDDNGYYTIRLENYATGTVTTSTTTEIKPVDIVLVLDDSGSMAQSFDANTSIEYAYTQVAYDALDEDEEYYIKNPNGSYTTVSWCTTCNSWTSGCSWRGWRHQDGTKYDETDVFYERKATNTKGAALITAVNNFVESVNDEENKPTTGAHQMSIVKFSGDSKDDTDAAEVINVWTPVNDATVNGLKLTGNDMVFDGGTWIEKGLTKAKEQLESLTTTGRQRVVIVFTDGKPGGGSWYNQGGQFNDAESVGASAINIAESIKDMENTTIYTIAVLDGADPTAAVVSPATGIDDVGNANKINAILHAISSNYPDATAQSSGDTLTTTFNTINPLVDTNNNGRFDDDEPGYYLSASSASELNSIFQTISSNIQTGGSTTTLTADTVVKDVLTETFELPNGADSVRVYVADVDDATGATPTFQNRVLMYGTEANGTTAAVEAYKPIISADGKSISVSGFNFSENWVGTETDADGNVTTRAGGKKLIIEIDIKTVDGFLGGNDVETNVEDLSGIFKDQESADNNDPVVNLPNPPNVDVPLWRIQVEGKHQHLFLSNEADINELLQSFSLVYQKLKEDGTVDTSVPPYKVNGIRNGYATLQFTLADTASGYAMVYTIEPGADVGTWSYVNTETGDPVDNFDVTPFLTDDAEYRISYDVIPIEKADGSTGVAATSGYLDVGVHVYKPTFTFRDTVEDYLATPANVGDYYNKNNLIATETWTHTYYDEITVAITVSYDNQGVPSYSYTVTDKDNKEISTSPADWNLSKTIDFAGYGSTRDEYYNVVMSGPKPSVKFTYSPLESTWIQNNQVTSAKCVPVNVDTVQLTSTNTHEKVEQSSDGAVSRGEYTTTSVYTEGSGSANVVITKDGTETPKAITGIPYITTMRQEADCTLCGTSTEEAIYSTDIHSTDTKEFVVHIKNAFSELKIIKKGLSVGESAIFTVTGYVPNGTADGKEQTWTVVLTATENKKEPSVTITGLLVGSTATVEEAGNWSWRYQTTQYEPMKSVEILPKTQSTATITITNTNKNNQWLDDEVAVHNNFDGDGTVTVID